MRIRLIFTFILAILIPTFFLAYFGLLSVRNEKSIVERNMRQKYEAIVNIVTSEIEEDLTDVPAHLLVNPLYLEPIFLEHAALFKDDIVIFNSDGKAIGGQVISDLDPAVLVRPIANTQYTIAVYERYPLLLEKLEERKQGLYFYVAIIIFSALSILVGGFATLWALSMEWRFAKIKSEFVSHLSHDLRRPLTSIRMFSEMLKEDHIPSEEKRQEYYAIISKESDRLTHLANNILDFSRIEKGRIRYAFKEVEIVGLVKDTVERFKTYMVNGEVRPVTLNIIPLKTGKGTDSVREEDSQKYKFPLIKINENAIAQALMNLFSNALKYSPPDKEIVVNLIQEKKKIIIEVIDKGAGIPKPEQKKIFQKFYRVAKKHISQVEGSGLGLVLVKYAVEAHRGKIKVESIEGKGSKFTIILPG